MIDRNELKRLAQAATPGPWIAARGAGWFVHRPDAEKRRESAIAFGMTPACSLVADPTAQWWEEGEAEANAKLIAAANPQTILALLDRVRELEALLNTPEIEDFDTAVPLEAAHQQLRWGSEHDVGKQPEDWFWLLGYLAGKALASCRGGNLDKAKHHCISSAAALRNWHAHLRSGATHMRPGIDEPTAIKEAQDE